MNPKYEIHEWIDRYLDNKMNEQEQNEFEEAIVKDEYLAKTLEAQKITNQIVIGKELIQLKKQMSQDMSTAKSNLGAKSNKIWYYISGTLLVVVVILYFSIKEKNTSVSHNNPKETNQEKKSILDSAIALTENDKELSKKENEMLGSDANKQKKSSTNNQYNARKTNLCLDTIINFSCQARGTCAHREDGAIEIDIKTIKSGNAPYSFSILPSSGFKTTTILSDLKPGIYTLYIKDAKQCQRKLNIEIEVPILNCINNDPIK